MVGGESERPPATTDPLRILVVCTGNVCRSPFAERLLQAQLDGVEPGGFSVTSAGTRALVGEPAQPGSARLASELGVTLEGFRARQLTRGLIEAADLVLAASTAHRKEVLWELPGALRTTFTVREFARIVGSVGPRPDVSGSTPRDAWATLISSAHGGRWRARTRDARLDDVADPYGLGDAAYQRMASEMVPAIEAIVRAAGELRAGRTDDGAQPAARRPR